MTRFVVVLLALLTGSLALAQEAPPPEPPEVTTTEPGTAPPPVPTPSAQAPDGPPAAEPTAVPVAEPAVTPTVAPVVVPAAPPAPAPAAAPAVAPAPAPTAAPTAAPVAAPSAEPPVAPLILPYAGRWEGDLNAALSFTSGNNDSESVSVGTDIVYQAPNDKLSLYGNYLETRVRTVNNGVVSDSVAAQQWRLGTRYDSNFTEREFGFVGLELSHDQIQQLVLRGVVSVGLGHHLDKSAQRQWDVYAGLTDRSDFYEEKGVLINDVRLSYLHTIETLFGQESTQRLTETTRFKQKLVIYPSLGNDKGTRATLDAGLQVDFDKNLSLSVKLQGRYDSLTQAPVEKYDMLLLMGVAFRFKE